MDMLTIAIIVVSTMLLVTALLSILIFIDVIRASWKGFKPTVAGILVVQLLLTGTGLAVKLWPQENKKPGSRGELFTSKKSCDAPDRPYWCDL